MERLTIEEARELAKVIAQQIVTKEIVEYAGGMKIWKEIIDNLDVECPDDLWPFKSNTSAIEDCKWNAEEGGTNNAKLIHKCEQEIMDAAKKLIKKV